MGNKCSSRHRACGMLAAVCAAILPVVANALDPAIDRIEAIERHIRELQSELQRLKSPRFSTHRSARLHARRWRTRCRELSLGHRATLAGGGRQLHPMLRSAEADPDTAFV